MKRHIVEVKEFEVLGNLLDLTVEAAVSTDPGIPESVLSYSVINTLAGDSNGDPVWIRGGISCLFDSATDKRLRQAILDAIEEE